MNSDSRQLRYERMDREMVDVLRRQSAAEKVAMAASMWRFARDSLRNFIRSENPTWSASEVENAVAGRLASGSA